MNVVLILLSFGVIYLLMGVAVAMLYVAPWLEKLSPAIIRNLFSHMDGVELDTHHDLEIARKAYILSIIPAWPIYAYRVATYGEDLSGK
ncbi:hypothetical protein [Sphingomonas sp. 3-13AW]|uniref:hypothetical protein n=1 Tax=Sphingomonas sp. 3-13AW TaxID=3050450 RepID=UPI003BB65BDB